MHQWVSAYIAAVRSELAFAGRLDQCLKYRLSI